MRTVNITVEVAQRYDIEVETDKTDAEIQDIIENSRYMDDIEDELGGCFNDIDAQDFPLTQEYWDITEC